MLTKKKTAVVHAVTAEPSVKNHIIKYVAAAFLFTVEWYSSSFSAFSMSSMSQLMLYSCITMNILMITMYW